MRCWDELSDLVCFVLLLTLGLDPFKIKGAEGSDRFTLPASFIAVNISWITKEVEYRTYLVFSKVLLYSVLELVVLVTASTETSFGARNFIQKHIIKKRGRSWERNFVQKLLTSKEVVDCAPSLGVFVYPRIGVAASVKTCPHNKGVSSARASPISALCYVVVFFTLTDRASTIPNNTRGCQSGTWSAGQKKIRGTSTKLQ